VLFADVVHSMDMAAAIGTERLREIMTELLDRSSAVVKRYDGTVSQFTGDGIMAVFGAPVTLEDHALRACMAAHDIQHEIGAVAEDVMRNDGVALQLRIGLNSGQVIAGEIGTSAPGYTTIGEQVGMAQRMESVAPAGGVLLSESTARLVENAVDLAEPVLVHIKGADAPVPARRLVAIGEHQHRLRNEPDLVGRAWELDALTAILTEATCGAGCVVTLVGPPGIGKSRLTRETAKVAASRGVAVFSTYCESHASDVPFHVVARMLRTATGVDRLSETAARVQLRAGLPDAASDDLLFFEDLLGIRDTDVALPDVAPDARRRRLTALLNAASLARTEPAVYIIEDVHWIDDPSEAMLAEFLKVIPQTPSLVLITCRPEYDGALSRVSRAQTIDLRPLSEAQTSALTSALLGSDPSVSQLASVIGGRAAGNPFFVEEMLRDIVERGKVVGRPGAYQMSGDAAEVDVPATLQATIGARIDRLDSAAKRTLNAAAVIGLRTDVDLLTSFVADADLQTLVDAELLDQVRFTAPAEFVFRHPLIRTVAYESQLKSDRAQLHRQLAARIESRGSADENAALIAEHLEAAGDLHAAFDWHLRAGNWSMFRDIVAAEKSWRRAIAVADHLPEDDPERMSMRIAPRTQLAAVAWRLGGGLADPGFEELRELCTMAGDKRSQAFAMAGQITAQILNGHRQEGSRLADELKPLLESIDDPALTIGMSLSIIAAKQDNGEMAESLRLAELVIDFAGGDPTLGNLTFESPLPLLTAMRGVARFSLGMAGWKHDFHQAITRARAVDPMTLGSVIWYAYTVPTTLGVVVPDDNALRYSAELLSRAELSGDNYTLYTSRASRGVALLHQVGQRSEDAVELLAQAQEGAKTGRFALMALPVTEIHIALGMAQAGDVDGAINMARLVADDLCSTGGFFWLPAATGVFVVTLLRRGTGEDRKEAQAAVDRFAAASADPGFVIRDIWLLRLRTLLAQAQGDEATYRDHRDRYRKTAKELGFEGHMAWAEAMD
jgi:adenylate cyclase